MHGHMLNIAFYTIHILPKRQFDQITRSHDSCKLLYFIIIETHQRKLVSNESNSSLRTELFKNIILKHNFGEIGIQRESSLNHSHEQ